MFFIGSNVIIVLSFIALDVIQDGLKASYKPAPTYTPVRALLFYVLSTIFKIKQTTNSIRRNFLIYY